MNVNITELGARSELKDNASAIQAAIDKCNASGGGRVTVPVGRFVTGTIRLKSNVELYLEHGAVLKATNDSGYNKADEYSQCFGCAHEGWDYRSLILAVNAENVAINGQGTIEGCDDYWYGEPYAIGDCFIWRDGFSNTKNRDKGNLRPGRLIVFAESKNIRVTDIHICGATAWCCHFHGCENVQVRGLNIKNDHTHANTDGIDIDCCKYVTVSDCIINTGDDCIAIRGSSERLTDTSFTCEYVTITNCVFSSSAMAMRIGVGISQIKHIRVSNIVVQNCEFVVAFNTSFAGRGNCELYDINVSNVSATGAAGAFHLTTGDVPVRNATFENIRAEVMSSSYVKGNKGSMSDITLRNVDLFVKPTHIPLTDDVRARRGEYVLDCSDVDDLRLENVRIFGDEDVMAEWTGKISF